MVERLVGTRLLREILTPVLLQLWNILALDNRRRLQLRCRWLWRRLRRLKHRLLGTLLLLLLLPLKIL